MIIIIVMTTIKPGGNYGDNGIAGDDDDNDGSEDDVGDEDGIFR